MNDPTADALGFAALPEELRARIRTELASDERLLWAAQPDPKRPRGPRRAKVASLVWVVGWLLLAVGCVLGILASSNTRFEGAQILLAIVVAGATVIGFLVGVAWLATLIREGPAHRRLNRSLYALTDQRALIWSPADRSATVTVRQFRRGSIRSKQVHRVENPDGSGDIVFVHRDYSEEQGFYGVADIRNLEVLFRQTILLPAATTESLPTSLED